MIFAIPHILTVKTILVNQVAENVVFVLHFHLLINVIDKFFVEINCSSFYCRVVVLENFVDNDWICFIGNITQECAGKVVKYLLFAHHTILFIFKFRGKDNSKYLNKKLTIRYLFLMCENYFNLMMAALSGS